jgi:putative restriction endonuclease
MDRVFGDIPGIIEGDKFDSRIELSQAKVHRPTQAGISGSENEGADSIVISGGYEDDVDFGDEIVYTGHGGRSNNSKVQVADQTLTRQNKALAISCENSLPVRVIRGFNKHSKFAPETGYRYDGLYLIEEYWHEKGRSGYVVWRFRLSKINYSHISEINSSILNEPESNYGETNRKEQVVNRIIRESKNSRYIKELYEYKCQICEIQIKTPTGYYMEAAHIKGLGKPHSGPDTKENLICLCPNHHVMFDLGMISIDDDFNIIGLENIKLKTQKNHNIDNEFVNYHREHHFKKL